jgi:tight adherence protein C
MTIGPEYLPYLTAALIGLAVLLFGVGVLTLRPDPEMRSRLNEYLTTGQGAPLTTLELELSEPFFRRAIVPLLHRLLNILAWMWPKNRLDDLRHKLVLAGQPGGLTTSDFIGIKGWCGLVILGGGLLTGYLTHAPRSLTMILLWTLLGFLSFFMPDIWLSRRVSQRQQEIARTLPDMLDMLVVAIEAGLSFENAILEITARWRNSLSLEMLRVQRDIGVGQSRRQALLALNYRTGVPDIAAFVSAINQAEELGVSISRVLMLQAEELRIKRRQRAQEQANKAPIKMLFPMVFLIFPALFAVLLGPGVPDLLRALNAL